MAHWSLDRPPPSWQVSAAGKKEAGGGGAVRIYKLDTLCYVAEGADGAILGQTGQMPSLIKGLPYDLARYAGQIVSSIARFRKPEKSDEGAEDGQQDYEVGKHTLPELGFENGGWERMKAGYAESFGPMLEQLRRRAGRTWEIEDAVRKFGEGIVAGETLRVALLGEACVQILGEGARHVRAALEDPPALILDASPAELPHEVEFEVAVSYATGESERLPFFVVSRGTPSNTKVERARARGADDNAEE